MCCKQLQSSVGVQHFDVDMLGSQTGLDLASMVGDADENLDRDTSPSMHSLWDIPAGEWSR